MSADDFAVVHEARDSQKHITELKCAQRGPQFLRYHNQRSVGRSQTVSLGRGGQRAWGYNISVSRYAPGGDLLAAGSHDHRMYAYAVDGGGYALQNMITQHDAAILRVDFQHQRM